MIETPGASPLESVFFVPSAEFTIKLEMPVRVMYGLYSLARRHAGIFPAN